MQDIQLPLSDGIGAITITSPDLDKSLVFYEMLGFKEVLRMNIPFPGIQITDGALLIMLRQDNAPFISLTYYMQQVDQKAVELEAAGMQFILKPGPADMIRRYITTSPDGLNISLVSFVEGFKQPAGPSLLTMPQEDLFNPAKYVNKSCGIFGEFAHPVKDLEIAIPFWQTLGFSVLSKMELPYPWAIMSDGISIIGLHQTIDFSKPTITFFAADSKEKIEALKKKGMTDFVEKNAQSILISTPEDQCINLFQLGM